MRSARRREEATALPTDAEDALDKIQCPSMKKLSGKRAERQASRQHSQQRTAESPSSKTRNKSRVPRLATVIQQSVGTLSQSKQARKRNKWNPSKKGESKAVTVCRRQWVIRGKPSLHGEAVRTIPRLQQSCRTEISVHQFTVFLYTRHQHTQMIRGSPSSSAAKTPPAKTGGHKSKPQPGKTPRTVQGPACAPATESVL